MAQERIGFVGLGLMGHGMAANIVAKGYGLTVYAHRNRAPVEDLVSKGASEAGSLAELAAASDIVFLCLTGSPQVAEVVAALNHADVKKRLLDLNIEARASTPEQLGTLLASEIKRWGDVITRANIPRQ